MAQFVSDTFTGTDGTGLATYGADWIRSTVSGANGTMGLSGNRVFQSGATGSVYAHATPATQPDYDVSANHYIVTASGTPSVGVLGRMLGTGAAALTFYQARIVTGTGIVLARFINSTATTLASMAYTPVAGQSPKLTLRMVGSQISVLLDDVQVLTASDANITAAGYVGMRMVSANTNQIHIDNFSADTPSSGAAVDGVLAWTEASETVAASVAATVSVASSWTEGAEQSASTAVATVRSTAAWAEGPETVSIAGAVLVQLGTSWNEQGEGFTAAGSVGSSVTASASWAEPAEGSAIAVAVAVTVAVAWTEAGEVSALSGSVGNSIAVSAAWVEASESLAALATVRVDSAAGWAEQSDTFGFSAHVLAAAGIGWAEGSEFTAASVAVAEALTATASWAEGKETTQVQILSASLIYARAPSGAGFAPRRSAPQARPLQQATARPEPAHGARPAAIQRNNR